MRLFIAVQTPFQDEFKAVQEQLSGANLKLTKEFHITLKFLGDVKDSQLNELVRSLSSIKFRRFSVTLDNLGSFPIKGKPRVIWIGAQSKQLLELQNTIESNCNKLGFQKSNPFHPHVTLARVRYIKDWDQFKHYKVIIFNTCEFQVFGFELIKSTLTPNGPVYETVKTFQSKPL